MAHIVVEIVSACIKHKCSTPRAPEHHYQYHFILTTEDQRMKLHNILHTMLFGIVLAFHAASVYAADDDAAAAADDGGNQYYQQDDDDKSDNYSGGDDFIKYWTEYAILPQKCIHYGGKDVIVYAMYEKYYNHCADKALGTYSIDVPTYMTAYANQLALNGADLYGDDYAAPDTTYVNCYPYESSSGAVVSKFDLY